MMDFSDSQLEKIIAHEVGNKLREEGVSYTSRLLTWSDKDSEQLFLRYALSSFKNNEVFQFAHSTDLNLNEVYTYISKIFDNPKDFEKQSKNIALHLYNKSTHPKVSRGELYIVYFKDCIIDGMLADAIGIYKSETKEPFLKPIKKDDNYILNNEKGFSVDKIDKGCIVFNADRHHGFKVCVVDNVNKSDEAQYWKDHFLQITPCNDDYHQTKNFLTLTKTFVTKQLSEEYEIDNADKAEYLKRSVDYFKTNQQFDEKEFSQQVFGDSNVIKSFTKYRDHYIQENDIAISNDFEIDSQVVKKQAKSFKSVLKLDKNFHIYIHGNTELIEKGFDSRKGKHYYKIYFDREQEQ